MKQTSASVTVLAAFMAAANTGSHAFVIPVTRAAGQRSVSSARLVMTAATAVDAPTVSLPLIDRFGDRRGATVKPVSESMARFCQAYPRPVLPQFRSLVNDLIQSTHLTTVNARFTYDAVFALGLQGVFSTLMKSYPGDGEAAAIFTALCGCLDLDAAAIASDAAALSKWATSASESDVVAAIDGQGDSPLATVVTAVRADEFYQYSKMWGLGLLQVMSAAGMDTSVESVEGLVGKLNMPIAKARQDVVQYNDVIEKMGQMEQLFKEIEIRELKKSAERLEEKARRAQAASAAADTA